MRRLLVISCMYPSSTNSVLGIFVHKQVKKIIEQGWEVQVVCPVPYIPSLFKNFKRFKKYYDIPKVSVIDGVEVFYPRYFEFPRGLFLQYSGYFMYLCINKFVRKLHSQNKFDIIHAHTAIPVGYSAMLMSKCMDIPYVVTIHGQDFQYTINKNRICKKNILKVLANSDKIVTVSNKLKNIITNEKLLKKTCVIGNGINPEEHINKSESGIYNKYSKVILSASSLIKTKGIRLNIMAVNILVKKYPDLQYIIIGDGEEMPQLYDLVQSLNLQEHVKFLGWMSHENVIEHMLACNIFSLPSYKEGFGIVYIEAMSCGKPVIAVKGEGIEDVIEDNQNGFLVRPQNVEDIVETIDFLFRNPEKAEIFGSNGKNTVLGNYTWHRNAEKTIRMYDEILCVRGD